MPASKPFKINTTARNKRCRKKQLQEAHKKRKIEGGTKSEATIRVTNNDSARSDHVSSTSLVSAEDFLENKTCSEYKKECYES